MAPEEEQEPRQEHSGSSVKSSRGRASPRSAFGYETPTGESATKPSRSRSTSKDPDQNTEQAAGEFTDGAGNPLPIGEGISISSLSATSRQPQAEIEETDWKRINLLNPKPTEERVENMQNLLESVSKPITPAELQEKVNRAKVDWNFGARPQATSTPGTSPYNLQGFQRAFPAATQQRQEHLDSSGKPVSLHGMIYQNPAGRSDEATAETIPDILSGIAQPRKATPIPNPVESEAEGEEEDDENDETPKQWNYFN